MKKTTKVFLLSQIVCSARGCRTSVKDIRHGTCRQHAPCRQVLDDDSILWNPELCSICKSKVAVVENDQATKEDRRNCKMQLKAWARGFHENRPGHPFLIAEKWRAMLFPKTQPRMVYSGPSDALTQDVVIQIEHLDVANENMEDADQDPLSLEELLKEPSNPSSFPGFGSKKSRDDDEVSQVSTIPSMAPTTFQEGPIEEEEDLDSPATKPAVPDAAMGAIPKVMSGPPGFLPAHHKA